MASIVGFFSRARQIANPPCPPKSPGALKFGILGAADIASVMLAYHILYDLDMRS